MGRLILVEGIPGSGKTTISKKIADYLSAQKKTNFYEEGVAHPADLAWCACIPKDQFDSVIRQFPDYEKLIRDCMYEEEGYFIVPYTRLPVNDSEFWQKMESFEVYDNRVGLETFVDLHLKKWIKFGKQAKGVDEYTVFECAFLQNHINELLLFHFAKEDEIENYLLKLMDTVKELNPVMIYLNQPDIYETIRRVSDVRVDEQGNKVWMERAIQYIESCSYGLQHKLKGLDGLVEYFTERKKIELNIMKKLPIKTHIINNPEYNWQEVWRDIEEILKEECQNVVG